MHSWSYTQLLIGLFNSGMYELVGFSALEKEKHYIKAKYCDDIIYMK